MQILLTAVLAIFLLLVAAYAHRQVPVFTQGSSQVVFVRTVLIIVGGLFGWLGASGQQDGAAQIIWFFIGFGMVHVPAAAILFIKGQRGAGKS